jgi:cytochrome c-type biogenesis protein CcmH/NrfF
LTGVETRLRHMAGEGGYDAGFIEHYIYPVLYPPGLTRSTQLWLAAFVLVLNGVIYGWILLRRQRNKPNGTASLDRT